MKLKELLKDCADIAEDLPITGLALDSRIIKNGNVFIALAGSRQHGLAHVEQAVEKGACAVVFEPVGAEEWQVASEKFNQIPFIAIENLATKLGEIAARFYRHPSRAMDVIGITGTNGKTSCSQFLGQVLEHCGIIGTLGWGEWGHTAKTLNTTPDALANQQILAELLANYKRTVAMEVSSHGLEQGRVNGVYFKGAVYTNISRDHLDYHGTMDAYFQAKLELLRRPGLAFAVINLDDAYSTQMLDAVPASVVCWGFSVRGNSGYTGDAVQAENIVYSMDGIEFDVRWKDNVEKVKVALYGDFNTENVLAVLTVMLAMGISMTDAVQRLKAIKPVAGRMERYGATADPLIFIDYAHTPDALEKVLASMKKHCQQDLWVVFGCGGNRDSGKRPQMGACAEIWADHVIVTDDNPRHEENFDIVKDILAGCHSSKVEVIQNREQAIKTAVTKATEKDCVVIAGKGHEDYQEIKGVQYPFSDKQVVIEALRMRAAHQ
ncbi:MAG: UDP-N-acetylmuramoyl-L-alanyl-D-glutamate--2,6-diaminopimelate ligase [Methylococcaceae bacterium]|nr:UDP-N-acetylmuramoyl-L-alanyl-D-glutamate--2,6-diaminopimelate ligase [Methylococcaceae bacterium]